MSKLCKINYFYTNTGKKNYFMAYLKLLKNVLDTKSAFEISKAKANLYFMAILR